MEQEAKVEIVDLTRALATELSEHIPAYQRNLRPRWVKALASDIDAGRWRLADSAIVVATDADGRGQLQNGQHRVLARLEAEKDPPCPVIMLTRTVDDLNDYLVTDAGKKRMFADYLRLKSETSVAVKAAIARGVLLSEIGGVAGYTTTQKFDVSHAEMAQLWDNRDEEAMEEAVGWYLRLARTIGGHGARFLSVLYYKNRTEAPELDIEGFLSVVDQGPSATELQDGNSLNAGYLLHRRLVRWHFGDEKAPRTSVARVVLKAWGMWLANETSGKLFIPKGNEGLEIVPGWAKD